MRSRSCPDPGDDVVPARAPEYVHDLLGELSDRGQAGVVVATSRVTLKQSAGVHVRRRRPLSLQIEKRR